MTMNRLIGTLIFVSTIPFCYFLLWMSPDRPGSWKKAGNLRRLALHFSLWFFALFQIAVLSFGLGEFMLTAPLYYFIPIMLIGSTASAIITVEVIGTVAKSATWTLKKRALILLTLMISMLLVSATIAHIIRTKMPTKQSQETTSKVVKNLNWLNNTIWEFPGGEMEASKIIFRPDGNLVFEGGFADLNPGYWQYDEIAQELYFIIPKVTDEMLHKSIRRGRGEDKRVDQSKRSLIYDFDSKTEVFDFMGWNYFKKREY